MGSLGENIVLSGNDVRSWPEAGAPVVGYRLKAVGGAHAMLVRGAGVLKNSATRPYLSRIALGGCCHRPRDTQGEVPALRC